MRFHERPDHWRVFSGRIIYDNPQKSGRLNPDEFYPQCIGGERACPPEDCHGVEGYAEFLDAIEDPYHYDHEDSLAWIGGYFDPEHFNLDLVNKKFKYETQEEGRQSRER